MSNRRGFFALSLGLPLLGASRSIASSENAQDPKAPVAARLKIAQGIYSSLEEEEKNAPGVLDREQERRAALEKAERVALWSRRWMEAQSELGNDKAGRVAAVEGHLQ